MKSEETSPILFIVGPTASGKSDLAMRIAKKFEGEIVCADSQTIRRDLDIGTAKPTASDQKEVVHHMLDIVDPYDKYSVAEFKQGAEKAIDAIIERDRLPIIVGGTGLYVDSLLYNFKFRGSSSEYSREELEKLSVKELQEIIKKGDLQIPKNDKNPRHLIRAIESEGQLSKKGKLRKGAVVIGVDPGKSILQARIESRIQKMLNKGFLNEVDGVIAKYGKSHRNFDAIGYKIALECQDNTGEYDVEEIKAQFASSHRRYAKRQRAWFKRNSDIIWFEQAESAYEYLNNILQMY